MPDINHCNCYKEPSVKASNRVYNAPGLNAISYRVGTYSRFKENLLARLSGSDRHALLSLTSKDTDDFTIALLDAWAVVSDVLTFYQERIANENYLRTATERFSVLELARLTGYELRPGVAASTYIAFTLDDTPGALGPVLGVAASGNPQEGLPPLQIDAGIKIQSVPGSDEQAQLFETTQAIQARPEWNTIRPCLNQVQPLSINNELLVLQGTVNDLKKGDVVLIRHAGNSRVRKILNIKTDVQRGNTRIELVPNPTLPALKKLPKSPMGNINDILKQPVLNTAVINNIIGLSWKEEDLSVLMQAKKWSTHELVTSIAKALAAPQAATEDGVFAFRKRAFVFGYNAAKEITYDSSSIPKPPSEWKLAEKAAEIFLDAPYEEILPDSFIGIQRSTENVEDAKVFKAGAVNVRSRSAYGMSAKTTHITLPSNNQPWWDAAGAEISAIRQIVVYAQSEPLELAALPVEDSVSGDTIKLDRIYPGLRVGYIIALTGDRSDLKGVSASEIMTLKEVIVEQGLTVLTFTEALAYTYVRCSVIINANVAPATHGETVEEVLGSGDASRTFQQFTLRQLPLTYVSAASPSGRETTLEIRVNDLLWHEVDNFLRHKPEERIYVIRLADGGKTTVIFGDGITGKRLPTGRENVKAIYRKGIGTGGLVKAQRLSQLLTRPLGVKSAINLIDAEGGADAERLSEARQNVPLPILTLDRVVSLQDYEDFARAYTGIEKSQATWIWQGEKRHIVITVAGVNGETIKKNGTLFTNLLLAIRDAGDSRVPVTLASYRPAFFRLVAGIQMDPDHLQEEVLSSVKKKLRDTFSFKNRGFGQPVTYSEVVAAIQSIAGIVSVDIDKLYRSDQSPALNHVLETKRPAMSGNNVTAAELLTLDPQPLNLNLLI